MPTTFGSNTLKPPFLREHYGVHIALIAAAVLKKGQPVKLDTTGKLVAYVAADTEAIRLGSLSQNAAIGDDVTVYCKGSHLVNALSGGAVVPGPVEYVDFDATTGLPRYQTTTGATKTVGMALIPAASSGTAIEVLIF